MLIYLDNSATTRQYDEVTALMAEIMKNEYGNPSSLHRLGMSAEKVLKAARKSLAGALNVTDNEIIFTSGGTEADNMTLMGITEARKKRGNRIITSKVEHPAVLETCKRLETMGFDVKYVGVDRQGMVDIDELAGLLSDETLLISIMQVNNESGTIMPIGQIAQLKEKYNEQHGTDILLHTDAVQSFGKMNVVTPGVDMASFSAHKIHGPKGVGALYLRKGINLPAYITGGGQESNLRSGTENLPGNAGFGKAADMAYTRLSQRIAHMGNARDYLLKGLKEEISDIKVNGTEETGLNGEVGAGCPSVLNISFIGTRGEVLLHTLEQSEIYVSTGSACASNHKGKSHVLKAMGLSDREIEGAIRFSFNEFNTIEEMDIVLEKTKEAVARFRRLGSFR